MSSNKRPRTQQSNVGDAASDAVLRDLTAMYERAREEEQAGIPITTDCKIAVGEAEYFAHSTILIMRSSFFNKVFLNNMQESREKVVRLSHAERVSKQSILALLQFIYSGRLPDLSPATAWGLLKLIGGSPDDADYLGISDCNIVRQKCQSAILEPLEPKGIMDALCQANEAGPCAGELRQILIDNFVFHLSELSQDPLDFSKIREIQEMPQVALDVFKAVGSHMVVKGSWSPQFKIGTGQTFGQFDLTLSSNYPCLANSAAAVSDPDMSTGAGTLCGSHNWIQATFRHPITVRRMRLGIGSMSQGWSTNELHGATLEYCVDDLNWCPITRLRIPTREEAHDHEFASITAAKWRIHRTGSYLGVSLWSFHSF